jgi:hypothetical protein
VSDGTKLRLGLALAAGGAVLGVIGVLTANWWVAGAMVLLVVGQALNIRRIRARRHGASGPKAL